MCLIRLCVKAFILTNQKQKEEHWYCNRLVNEALIECKRFAFAPVHINVPISEPLFHYNVATLPKERCISATSVCNDYTAVTNVVSMVQQAQRPLIVIGQESWWDMTEVKVELAKLHQRIVVIQDKLSNVSDNHTTVLLNAAYRYCKRHRSNYVQTLLYI